MVFAALCLVLILGFIYKRCTVEAWKRLKFKNKPWSSLNLKKTVRPATKAIVEEVDGEMVVVGYQEPERFATQAERVFAKFGGAMRLWQAMKACGCARNRASIYKWTYAPPKGRGGRIPTSAWNDILKAARLTGVLLDAEDMRPDPTSAKPRGKYEKRRVK